jgi:hypothetical protein
MKDSGSANSQRYIAYLVNERLRVVFAGTTLQSTNPLWTVADPKTFASWHCASLESLEFAPGAQLSRPRRFARAVFRFIAVALLFVEPGIMPSY